MVEKSLPQYDPSLPGIAFYVGKEGPYKIYRNRHRSDTKDVYEVTTYVFEADDGNLVGVSDIGALVTYQANRRFWSNMDISYSIAKSIGKDFKAIDESVLGFLKNHITEN